MRDYYFFDFLFSNTIEYLIYALSLTFILYCLTRKTVGYFLDPFHFYYTFTYGTSYAVVLILYVHGYVSDDYFSFIIVYGFLFLITFLITSYISVRNTNVGLFYRLAHTCASQEKLLLRLFIIIYSVLFCFYLAKVSTAVFYTSRFEANRGLGGVVRIMDALRLIIAAWLYVYFIRSRYKKYLIGALLISVFGAVVSGAKFALLEQLYVIFVAGFVAERKRIKFNVVNFLLFALLAVLLLIFVLFILSKTSVALGYVNSQYLPGFPVTVELLVLRILANGDVYYLSLTGKILELIKIDYPLLQMFANTFGNGFMSNLFNFDFANSDIGRQIWLYWYPNDPIMRGPANHFDLTGYVYFGYVGGALFCSFVGFIVGKINGFKRKYIHSPAVVVAITSALYCRSLAMILNPSVGIAYIVDITALLVFMWFIASLSNLYIGGSRNVR